MYLFIEIIGQFIMKQPLLVISSLLISKKGCNGLRFQHLQNSQSHWDWWRGCKHLFYHGQSRSSPRSNPLWTTCFAILSRKGSMGKCPWYVKTQHKILLNKEMIRRGWSGDRRNWKLDHTEFPNGVQTEFGRSSDSLRFLVQDKS